MKKVNSQMKPLGGRGVHFVTSFAITSLILAVGFLIVWSPYTKESVEENPKEFGLMETVSPVPESNFPLFEGSIDSQRLASLSTGENSFERVLALDDVLARADFVLVNELYVESSLISPTSVRDAVQGQILQCLASIDPVQTLNLLEGEPRLMQERGAEAVFQEWASTDLDSAVEHASTLSPFFLREIALGAMVEVREDLRDSDIERIGRILKQSDFEIQDLITKNDPAAQEGHDEIWNKTLNSNRPFNLKYSALTRLAWRRIDQEGLNAIEALSESLTDWRTRRGVLRESIRWAAQSDPKSTFEFALSSFRETELHLVSDALKHWIEREPENAINAISQLEPNRLQTELYRNAISYWTNYAPREVLSNLELFPSELRTKAQREAFPKIRDFSVQEVTQLASKASDSDNVFNLPAVLGTWKNYAFEDAVDWVLENSEPDLPLWFLARQLFDNLTPTNAELALKRILRDPLDEREVGFEAYVVAHLVETDVDAAIESLPRIRNDKTRDETFKQIALWVGLRNQWDTVWRFGSRLPKSQRTSFYDEAILHWKTHDPNKDLARIEELPSTELQSRAAMWIIEYGHAFGNLSQIDEAKLGEYLTDEDREESARREIRLTH